LYRGRERGQNKARLRAIERRDKLTAENLTKNLNALERVGTFRSPQ
jgi:hypothetical protein